MLTALRQIVRYQFVINVQYGGFRKRETIRLNVTLLDSLMTLAGELVLGRNQLNESLARQDDRVKALAAFGQHVGIGNLHQLLPPAGQGIGLAFERPPERGNLHALLLQGAVGKKMGHGELLHPGRHRAPPDVLGLDLCFLGVQPVQSVIDPLKPWISTLTDAFDQVRTVPGQVRFLAR